MSVIAMASPTASAAVVLVVGARFKWQASRTIFKSSTRSDRAAMEDSGLEVMAIIVAPLFRRILNSEFNSLVSPLFPIDRTIRSEERRVGKECRLRWWWDDEKQ